MKEDDLLQPQREKKSKYPRKLTHNREITAPNQLWEMDVKYGFIAGEDRFFFLLCLIDVYDRAIVDYHIGLTCEGKHAAQILQRALWKRQQFDQEDRPVIRTDNGPQFISQSLKTRVRHSKLSMSEFHRRHQTRTLILKRFTAYWRKSVCSGMSFSRTRKRMKRLRIICSFTTNGEFMAVCITFHQQNSWRLSHCNV